VKKLPAVAEMVWCTRVHLVAHLTWNDSDISMAY